MKVIHYVGHLGWYSRRVLDLGLNPVLKLRILSRLSFVLKPYSQRVTCEYQIKNHYQITTVVFCVM